jgi:two-component system phosphate regulon sensor histidine kinase PhoR
LGRPPALRLATIVVASELPTAVGLVALSVKGKLAPGWAGLAIAAGLGFGLIAAAAFNNMLTRRAERLEAMGDALARRQLPSHLLPDERDAMSRAERRLLDAADTVIATIGSLDQQREEFEAILRGMIEAVVVTGVRGEVVMMNGAARQVFGLLPETDYRNRDFIELCRDPRLQEFVGLATASGSGEVMTAEFALQNPTSRHLQVSAAPVLRADGVAAARVLVFHDVTRLKSYETARADFVANLTHELRTPLAAICGYAETLSQGVDDRTTERRFISIIERQSRRLARLIDDLVSLSDLERGLSPLKLESLEPRRVAEEAAELMRETARRNGIDLEVRSAPDLPAISGDHDRMTQVMVNLLDNALKYTPRGGSVKLEVRAPGAASANGSATTTSVVVTGDTTVASGVANTGDSRVGVAATSGVAATNSTTARAGVLPAATFGSAASSGATAAADARTGGVSVGSAAANATIEARTNAPAAASSSSAASDARAGVEFVVTDTGEGIPSADIPRLTERFYRVDRARSRELGGTGLGLAIVKHILQLHQGGLRIESRLREGTTVVVWLPAASPRSS